LTIAYDATIDDERLDLHSERNPALVGRLPLIPSVRRGKSVKRRGVVTIEAKENELYTESPRPINTHGERTTETQAQLRVLPHTLSVFRGSFLKVQGYLYIAQPFASGNKSLQSDEA
jgi:diacylglycerol kinase family enzyme